MSTREWSEVDGSDTPRRCAICVGIPGYVTASDVMDLGMTYRQLDFWCQSGLLQPVVKGRGTGHNRLFSPEEVKAATTLITLVSAGVRPAAAHHAIRHGGQLAPGVRVVVA